MNSERLRRIEELYHQAGERPPDERETFLAEACANDIELLRDVLSLLARDSGSGPMERPVLELAAELLNDPPGAQWTAGTQVGPYQIVSRLGEGGMGEVFKARDTRLGREVAIKAVHQEFSGRFQREARAISALNHPHVCTLHDIGPNYLVMELLDGETLACRMQRGRLPMDLVLCWGAQIADALAAAHAKGIIHRDLKPSNIMITNAGIKVLDFGLATFSAGTENPDSLTESGMMVGTPAYMAPEQLEAKACDARTDIFALGLVLYEMATGRKAFTAGTQAALIAEIMRGEPSFEDVSPPPLAGLIKRCLKKDPDDRWQTARDVALDLDGQSRGNSAAGPIVKHNRRLWVVAAGSVVLAAALVAALSFRTDRVEPSVVPLTSYPGSEVQPSLSPDGSQVAFSRRTDGADNYDIWVKQIGPGNPLRLTSDPLDDLVPRWSPDGKWIAFLRGRLNDPGNVYAIYAIPALGGPERKLAETGDAFPGATFGDNLLVLDWSPDGQWLVILQHRLGQGPARLALLSFETGEIRQLTSPAPNQYDQDAAFAPDGHALAFLRHEGGLMLQPLSKSLQPQGPPQEIPFNPGKRIGSFCWTADSRDLIVTTGIYDNSVLWRVPASGTPNPTRLASTGDAAARPTISRRGGSMAFARYVVERNIWSLDLDEHGKAVGEAQKVFDSSKSEICPRFSPDGTKVAFESSRSGNDEIWVCKSDGSDCAQLTSFGDTHAGSPAWSPDGKWIAFDVQRQRRNEIYIVASGGGKPRLVTPGVVPRWSPDGQWLYFRCNGVLGNVCRTNASGGELQQVTRTGGVTAEFSPDGKWVYYSGNAEIVATHLRRIPSSGGDSMEVLPEVSGRNFAVVNTGVWYLTPAVNEGNLLNYYDFDSKSTRTVYRTSHPIFAGLSISPDRRRILFTQTDLGPGSDIILVENFR